MKRILLMVLACGLMSASLAKADEARLLRFPATNGTDIVFSYAGDLFTAPLAGGEAKRLTSHIGYEMFAKYSPDGKTIAFTGEYDGNREVYLIPATGGEPVRLTYTSTNSRDDLGDRMGPNNIVMAWTTDGKYVIYRNRTGDGFPGKLWKVSIKGGMPEELPLPEGGFCSYSPDGKKLAYNRVMREFRTWKYYRGGMADEVWVYDGKSVEKITDNPAQDIFPMWVGDEIYFASDRDMTMNIFVYNTKTKATSKVTSFDDFDVKFPSTNGKLVVFEKGGFLYKLDPATKKAEQIHVTLASDLVYSRPEMKKVQGRGFSVSPDGKRAVTVARGEVFDVPVGKGITRNITNTPGANERGATWSPDGKYVAYISDSTGENEIYLYEASTGTTVQATKDNDTYISNVMWAPDSKHLYYTDRKNRLVEVDPAAKTKKVVYSSPEGGLYGVSFSPDSKWIAYTKSASNEMGIVYVQNLATGKAYPVTEKWYNSGSPMFSSDGKYLLFTADRDLTPIYSRIEWNYSYSNMSAPYMVMLAKDTPSPLLPTDSESNPVKEDEKAAPGRPEGPGGMGPGGPGAPGAKPGAPKDKPAEKVAETKIDPDGLIDRVVKLPISGRVIFCDGKKVWFSGAMGGPGGMGPGGPAPGGRGGMGGGAGIKTYDFATGKTDDCGEGMISYRLGDKKAVLNSRGKSTVVNFPSPKLGPGGDEIDGDNMYANIDYSQEWPQIYNEVWRAFRDGYYLENMHGRDWKGVKAKYEPLLPYVKTRLDLNYILGAMISEVASGHAYVTPGSYPKPERIQMGLLGAKLSKDKGYFKIDHIYSGATYRPELRSPLTEPGMDIAEGDYITAINGKSLKDVDNIYKCLIGKADKLVELTVNKKAAEGGRKVVVKPIGDEYPLEHYEWIQKNIKTVEEKSGGKVGYIYIPDMGAEGLNEFARYWYPQLDKEALIIDNRENGGGNVSPMILERLQRVVYRMNAGRGSNRVSTIPDGAHVGPKVLLINKYSASDGDLFPWGFKANNLGTVIGTRTWGGIIGIGGSLPYMDGTDVRVPGSTSFDPNTGEWIIENHGVDPDIVLDNDPIKEYAGTDEQLLKAIEVALEQIKTQKSHKDLPGKPEPRTFKDLGLPQIK